MMRARRLLDPQRVIPKLLLAGGWLFAAGSLVPLLWLIWLSGGGLLRAGFVFDTLAGGEHVTMPLLSYSGWPGFVLLWGEALVICGAILLTAFPRRVPLGGQRIGHVVLVAWSMLWTLGTGRLALADPVFRVHALIMAGLCVCTVYRAWRHWTPTSGTAILTACDAAAPNDDEPPVLDPPGPRRRAAAAPPGSLRPILLEQLPA
jgi:hypothetical protein